LDKKGLSRIQKGSAAAKLLRLQQVHPCSHQKKTLELLPFNWSYSQGYNHGDINNEYIVTTSDTWEPSGYWAQSGFPPDPLLYLSSLGKDYTAAPFITPDWFSLLDSFNEACDSFIPSNFFLGEDIVENDIFVDAFKIVLNPSNAIKVLLKHFSRDRFLRKKTLGEIARLSRTAANTDLTFEFGIAPAINDIKAALSAHSKVERRLKYLNDHAGKYVPVRVRRDFVSPISDTRRTDPNSYSLICSDKRTTGCIGSYGRVREDLNWKDTYAAYAQYFGLNKIIGLAWELIPFSFVVDWFTNAQERINSLTRFRIGGPFTQFVGFSCSFKTQLVEEYIWTPHNSVGFEFSWIEPTSPVTLARVKTSSYDRYLSIPETSGVVDLSSLGLFQLVTGGSLLIQRLFK
jgi:hypothetical protein